MLFDFRPFGLLPSPRQLLGVYKCCFVLFNKLKLTIQTKFVKTREVEEADHLREVKDPKEHSEVDF